MNLRRIAFNLLDFAKGGNIQKDIKQIAAAFDTIQDHSVQLATLLRHASSTVEAYASLKGCETLSDFPVVNKVILRDQINYHLSSQFDIRELSSTTTSGSTGTPFKIFFDKRKLRRHKAALIFMNEIIGAPIGERLYYLRVWNKINGKNKVTQLLENIIPIEVSHFDNIACNDFLESIGKKKAAILGFSSAVVELTKKANYCPPNLTGIITMSEHFPEIIRQEAINKFGCQVNSRYSNMENGLIAQQINNSDEYYINSADFIVEILHPEKDEGVEEGHLGRIVITDLYNYAMPFIRYDTGDMGILKTLSDGRRVLSKIEGRKCDMIYDATGNLVSAHVISNSLWYFPEIYQYQFIQKDKACYRLKLNLKGAPFNRQNELESLLKQYLGKNASISFEFVDEIPVLNSGKRRYIINELA